MWLTLAFLIGASLGVVVHRGDFCMHSAFRELVAGRPGRMMRAFLLALATQLIVVNALTELGWLVTPFPAVTLVATVLGGLVFGTGMVLAKG